MMHDTCSQRGKTWGAPMPPSSSASSATTSPVSSKTEYLLLHREGTIASIREARF